MERFEVNQRIEVVEVSRLANQFGGDVARWALGRLGVVHSLSDRSDAAWIRLDDTLPAPMRGKFAPSHPLGRNVLLAPRECEPARDLGYAPFHRVDFENTLDIACSRFDHAYLIPPADATRPERAWWRDVTQEMREKSATGLGEYVFRFGIEQRKVTLLIYSSISTSSQWSRPAKKDAIRFVHEVRRDTPPTYLDTDAIVKRTGTAPLDRVVDRTLELLAPGFVRLLQRRTWSTTAYHRAAR